MLSLLAKGNSLSCVTEMLSREFSCSSQLIYRDYANMPLWAQVVEQDKDLTSAFRSMNENNEKFKSRRVLNQIGLAQELGLIKPKPAANNIERAVTTPFEADQTLREALLDSVFKQRAEKEQRNAANETDASRH